MSPQPAPVYVKAAAAPGIANSAVPVLIVDDMASERSTLVSVLSPLGYHVVEADSGACALRCLVQENFAVILLSVSMPIMDGFETAQLIRQRQQSELTPIIFITARDKGATAGAAAYATGAADVIFAPVPLEELRSKVAVFANLYLRAEFLSSEAARVASWADELTRLTEAAPIGIFCTDADDNYSYVNPYWSEMTGIDYGNAIGKSWDIILGPADAGAVDARTVAFTERPTTTGIETPFCLSYDIVQAGGVSPRRVHVQARPRSDAARGEVGWVGTLSFVCADLTPGG